MNSDFFHFKEFLCTKNWTWIHIKKSGRWLSSKRKLLHTASVLLLVIPSFLPSFLLSIFLSSSRSCWGIINKASPESFPSSVQLTSPRNCPLPYTNSSACENKIKANFSIKLVQIGRQQCAYPCTTIPHIRKSTENFFLSPFFPLLLRFSHHAPRPASSAVIRLSYAAGQTLSFD